VSPQSSPKRGRPRSVLVDDSVRLAVITLLERDGYNDLRVDDVAEMAGVSKTTIYRRWPTKAALIVDVLRSVKSQRVPMPTTGDFEDDLRSIIYDLYDSLEATPLARALPGLIAEKMSDPELARAIEELWSERKKLVGAVIRRGIRSKQVRADLDVATTLDLLAATAYYRLFITGQPLDRRSAKRHVDSLLALTRPLH
jgi:AcrR family transcriptional regulator